MAIKTLEVSQLQAISIIRPMEILSKDEKEKIINALVNKENFSFGDDMWFTYENDGNFIIHYDEKYMD